MPATVIGAYFMNLETAGALQGDDKRRIMLVPETDEMENFCW